MPLLAKSASRRRTADVLTKDRISFKNLFLQPAILRGLEAAGYTHPSPIQTKAIPIGRFGADLLAQAKAGTGKTLVFTVIILESLVPEKVTLQALILAPTREIALQITNVITTVGQFIEPLVVLPFIGGIRTAADRSKLVKGVHCGVGTPGRVLDLLESGVMKTSNLRTFVMDEADQLLNDDFQADLLSIYNLLPKRKQVMAFSATFPEEVLHVATSMMRKPQRIRLCGAAISSELDTSVPGEGGGEKTSVEEDVDSVLWLHGVTQYRKVLRVPRHTKKPNYAHLFRLQEESLFDLLSSVSFHQAMVFSNHRGHGERLCEALAEEGFPSAFICGEQAQEDRSATMEKFHRLALRILVTTDLTARGVDVSHVNLVVNVGLPKDKETYLHRVGRTGRFGTHGIAVTILTEKDEGELDDLCETLGIAMEELPAEIPAEAYAYDLPSEEERAAMKILLAAKEAAKREEEEEEEEKKKKKTTTRKRKKKKKKQKQRKERDVYEGWLRGVRDDDTTWTNAWDGYLEE